MVGAAVAVCRGDITQELLNIALRLQIEMHMPLAPATGLLLRTAGFSELDSRAGSCAMDRDQARDCMLPSDGVILLSDAGTSSAETFVRTVEAAVEQEWLQSGAGEAWLGKLQCLRVPAGTVLEELRSMAASAAARDTESRAQQYATDRKLREKELASSGTGGSFKGLVPRRFAAELMVRFKLLPGRRVSNLQHALSVRMRRWHRSPDERPPSISPVPETNELLDYVASVGADVLADEGDADR